MIKFTFSAKDEDVELILMDIFSDQLLAFDHYFLEKINQTWSNEFLDQMLPIWREKRTWIPLYLLIVIISFIKLKRKAILFILLAIACVSLGDVISSHFLKPTYGRIRPCGQDLGVILRNEYCPGNGSFTSSHATTHFALAMFLFVTLKKWLKNWVWIFILWAFIIGYAQVYVGIHFPLDIITGGILGSILGIIFGLIFKKIYQSQLYSF